MKELVQKFGIAFRHRGGRSLAPALACLGAWLAFAAGAQGQTFQDLFSNRQLITVSDGEFVGDNLNATIEPGEPKHGGKTGGRSVWISWIAPTNGVVEIELDNASFDTLLSAYYFNSTNDTTLDKLRLAVAADDSEGLERESEIKFGVLAGQRYEIAVDGYFGATGSFTLELDFDSTPHPPPIILSTPADRSVNLGDPLTLHVDLTNTENATYKWFFNGTELAPSTPTLFIPSFEVANVGRYKLRIEVGNVQYFTAPTEIQINTDDATNTLAQGKILDASSTPLIGQGGSPVPPGFAPPDVSAAGGGVGVVRGYNGSQIFSTTYALVDTNEPPHCGVSNGVSYWLIYQPPTSGRITLDTLGSEYDTVMEAYTYNGALTGYEDLISVACNNDGFGTNGPSRVQFSVVTARQYIVVVQGVSGARGTAWLNYSLNTNQVPPMLLSQPASKIAPSGADVLLGPSVAGTAPLHFSWWKNAIPIPNQSGPAIFLPDVTLNDSASYIVIVTNEYGSLTATLPLRVLVPPHCDLQLTPEGPKLFFSTVPDQRYTVEEAHLATGPWQPWPNFYAGDGEPVIVEVPGIGEKFYRVRVE